jgi:hypothetical protein
LEEGHVSNLIECSSCGGLLPLDRPCCPHCHCKTSTWKRWLLLAAAAVGIGGASCGPIGMVEYGPAMINTDGGTKDAGPDAG